MTRTVTEKIEYRRDVCALLATAERDDIDVFFDAVKRRAKTLREDTAAAVMVGATVETVNLSPKALCGLRGTVKRIEGKRATVTLDEASTEILKRTRFAYQAPDLTGIPLTALSLV